MIEHFTSGVRNVDTKVIGKWAIRGEIAGVLILLLGLQRGDIINESVGSGLLGVSALTDVALVVRDRIKLRHKNGSS